MNNPYRSPNAALADVPGDTDGETYTPKIFAIDGRIGRLRYLTYSWLASLVMAIPLAIIGGILIALVGSNASSPGGMLFLIAVIYIPIVAISFIMAKRRLNDLDKSGWLSLLMLVPLVNFFIALYLIFWPGSPGSNHYGPKPEKNSWVAIVLGLILPIFLIGILAAIAIPAYQSYVLKAQRAQQMSTPSTPQP